MDLVSFYQNVLSLTAPWYVDRVECHPDAKRVDIWLRHAEAVSTVRNAWLNTASATTCRSGHGVTWTPAATRHSCTPGCPG